MEEVIHKTFLETTCNGQSAVEAKSLKEKTYFALKSVTLEPCIVLNAVATVMQAVIIQSLVTEQTCLMTYEHSEEFCSNITDKEFNLQLKRTASNYNLYRQILENAPCIFFAMFLGAWSDKHGPKMLILLPLIGDTVACAICAVLAYIRSVQPGYLLLSSALQGLTGGNLIFNVGVCSFIIVRSTNETRTTRIALTDAAFLIGAVLGAPLGSQLHLHFGYAVVFATAFLLNSVALVYTTRRLRNVPHVNEGSKSEAAGDLFRLHHLKNFFDVLLKKREGRGKFYIFLILLSAILVTFPRKGEKNIFFLYTQTKVGFTINDFSVYDAFSNGTLILGTLVVLPILSYFIRINDIIIAIVAIIASISNDILITFSDSPLMLYIAASLVFFSASASVICRSLLTKCVHQDELGKLLALLGLLLGSGVPILSGLAYTQIFNATIKTFPGACYLMSASLTILPALCFMWIYCELTKHRSPTSTLQISEI